MRNVALGFSLSLSITVFIIYVLVKEVTSSRPLPPSLYFLSLPHCISDCKVDLESSSLYPEYKIDLRLSQCTSRLFLTVSHVRAPPRFFLTVFQVRAPPRVLPRRTLRTPESSRISPPRAPDAHQERPQSHDPEQGALTTSSSVEHLTSTKEVPGARQHKTGSA